MEQAYDLKVLAERLKEAGLIEGEDMALQAYSIMKVWLKESAQVSATPFDNMVMPFIDQLDGFVLPQIDKIDGQVG